MPTYNSRKANRIIRHLRRYGLDNVANKALAKCGHVYITPYKSKDYRRYQEKRYAKAHRQADRAELNKDDRALMKARYYITDYSPWVAL